MGLLCIFFIVFVTNLADVRFVLQVNEPFTHPKA